MEPKNSNIGPRPFAEHGEMSAIPQMIERIHTFGNVQGSRRSRSNLALDQTIFDLIHRRSSLVNEADPWLDGQFINSPSVSDSDFPWVRTPIGSES